MKTKIIYAFIAGLLSYLVGVSVFLGQPISTDENSYVFQSYIFKEFKVKREYPQLASVFKVSDDMIILNKNVGWASRYSPGHSLWLLPGVMFNNPHIMRIISCALSVFFLCSIAQLLSIPISIMFFVSILSPFFILIYGTLLSHVSCFLFVTVMLWSYLKLRGTLKIRYAVIAGVAWSLLFLGRTYTAFLISIPYAIDAIIYFLRNRSKKLFICYFSFALCSFCGVLVFKYYNFLVTGDQNLPTYLCYEPSEKLGFGIRHLNGLKVDHTFSKGITNLLDNLKLYDKWLYGFQGGLLLVLFFLIVGWQITLSPLLITSVLLIFAGYVYFWFPGPTHIGPAYYFESLPFIFVAIGMGMAGIWNKIKKSLFMRISLPLVLSILVLYSFIQFFQEQKIFFNHHLKTIAKIMKTLSSAPKNSLVFMENIKYPYFGKLMINSRGLKSDPLVAQGANEYNYIIAKQFNDRKPFVLNGGNEEQLIPLKMDKKNFSPLPRVKIKAKDLHYLTGENENLPDGSIVRTAKEKRDKANYVAYGRFPRLVPGKYVADFYFSHIDCNSDYPLVCDIAMYEGTKILATTYCSGQHKDKIVSLKFELDDFQKVEPRVRYDGHGFMSIASIHIKGDE